MAFWDQLKAKALEMNGQLKTKTGTVPEQGVRQRQHGDVRPDRRGGRDHRPVRASEDRGADHQQRGAEGVPAGRAAARSSTGTAASCSRDFEFGKIEATATIAKLKSKQDQARAVIQIGIVIGGADGNFDQHERNVVRDACFAVGIAPAEFEL